MANISFFFPKERKGSALGLNAGLGNLGVSSVQFMVPLVISVGIFGSFGGEPQTVPRRTARPRQIWLQNAALRLGAVPILLVVAARVPVMNDIADAKASFAEQAVIFSASTTG